MSRSLLASRRFGPLFLTQFFSAFGDNFLKNSLAFLILFKMAGSEAEALVTLAGAVVVAPFFILSGLAGELADRYDKALVARCLKLAEIPVAAVAAIGFAIHSIPLLFAALAAFGVLAALFGPIKYGILPDHLADEELPRGNALIEGATFIAILLGSIAGGLAAGDGGDPLVFGGLLVGVAALGWLFTLWIPPTGEAAPTLTVDRNVARSTAALLRDLKADARLWTLGIMVSLFWLIGAIALALLPPMVKTLLGGSEMAVSVYLAIFAVAVAVGSGLGSVLTAGRNALLATPVAAVGMGIAALHLGWTLTGAVDLAPGAGLAAFFANPVARTAAIDLGLLALFGGIFIVPAFAAAQHHAPADRRARVIGAINVLSAAFIVAGGVAVALVQTAGLGVGPLFAILGVVCLASAAWIVRAMPSNPLIDLIAIVFRLAFRMEVRGRENLDKAGPAAVIALNHVSLLDAAAALAVLDREPVFAIDHTIAQRWWVRPFLKLTRALPLDFTRPLATRSLIAAVRSGETLAIFPEGRITVTGSLMKVYDGAAMVADKAGAKVVPVRIDGLEKSPFSYLADGQVRRRWFPKVTVTILEPVDLEVPAALRGKARRQAAGAALQAIMSDAVFRTADTDRSLFRAVVDAAREHGPGRVAVQDPIAGPLSYRRLLAGARVLGGKLSAVTAPGEAVGLLLPNAVGTAVTLLGLVSAGRVPAMLNFTAGAANLLSAAAAAELRTVVTSRAFVEKARLQGLVDALAPTLRIVWLEDVRATVTARDRIAGLLAWRRPLAAVRADERAMILFTSGSEGAPKGVVLSHRNILANAAQAAARIDFGPRDTVFSVLPVFHSFGLTGGLILPLVSGVRTYQYPSPLHYRIVPELVYQTNATILFGTDTFLAGYARTAHPYDLRSLRYVVAGAEPVKDATRRVYLEKFGLRLLEGYGVTETAPVLALNTPMASRAGTVGRLLPGVEARLEPVPGIDEGGRLSVRGPNVMMGYLRADAPGVIDPPADGWHDTGDIVAIDADGFVAIRGRAKRFAKIGGEMVSLARVEQLAAECWPGSQAVAARLADPRKGERIVLVTDRTDATRAAFLAFARSRGASELMVPADLLVVAKVPLLGSGKPDFAAAERLVRERAVTAELVA